MSASDLDFLTVMDGDDDWENFSPALMGYDFSDDKCVDGVGAGVDDVDAAALGCFKEADLISSDDLFLSTPPASVARVDKLDGGEDSLPIDLVTKEETEPMSSEEYAPNGHQNQSAQQPQSLPSAST